MNGVGPYGGDFIGGAWNGQGFFHSSPSKFKDKRDFLNKHLHSRDFWLISEAHGDMGMVESFSGWLDRKGCVSFWSHCGRHRGGVGIIIKKCFLDRFGLVEPEWLQLVPGEVACLRLRGDAGNLDLFTVYFPTGGQANDDGDSLSDLRGGIRRSLGNFIRDKNTTLTVLGGGALIGLLPGRTDTPRLLWSGPAPKIATSRKSGLTWLRNLMASMRSINPW